MRKLLFAIALLLVLAIITIQFKPVRQTIASVIVKPNYLHKVGATIKDRVKIPEGFTRVQYPDNSFEEYIRNYKLKSYGSKVINYDGNPYFADALIRIRSEYLWNTNQKDKIGFNFTSGHYCSWTKYAEGYRPKINGNKVTFSKTKAKDASKDNFYNYLNLIFNYSGTLSLYNELPKDDCRCN